MSTDKETSTDVQPKQRWLMFQRRQKMSNCESRAAPREAEEHRDSCAASGAQAAAAESRAAAPHSPRGRGQALLHSLRRGSRAILSRVAAVIRRRGSRAILSRVAAVIRRRGQQPGTQQHLDQGTGSGTAAAAPAAGAQSRAAAPHSPSPSPLGRGQSSSGGSPANSRG